MQAGSPRAIPGMEVRLIRVEERLAGIADKMDDWFETIHTDMLNHVKKDEELNTRVIGLEIEQARQTGAITVLKWLVGLLPGLAGIASYLMGKNS